MRKEQYCSILNGVITDYSDDVSNAKEILKQIEDLEKIPLFQEFLEQFRSKIQTKIKNAMHEEDPTASRIALAEAYGIDLCITFFHKMKAKAELKLLEKEQEE